MRSAGASPYRFSYTLQDGLRRLPRRLALLLWGLVVGHELARPLHSANEGLATEVDLTHGLFPGCRYRSSISTQEVPTASKRSCRKDNAGKSQ